ncbi:T9SS type A sorting domain-containing protein, partial [Flavobacterium sp. J49]|uniref:T9SS type A sorting domain-containing protein n=1 Tax=Flavobacterium sp. J49 TaxID=2718534 RepID=UPI0015932411
NQFTGLQPGVTYVITVAVEMFGEFGPYGKDCAVTVPTTAARQVVSTVSTELVKPFEATTYPNPFANNFMIDVKTSSQSSIDVKVFDMVGRLVEQRKVNVSELESTTIGDRYPSGVYNVIITQDEIVKTLRVVKR